MKIIFCVSSRNLNNSGGMNKVLAYTLPAFEEKGVECLVISAKSRIEVFKGIVKILVNKPFSFDFIIFNSLASVSNRFNKYWRIYYYISTIFFWKKVIYWHEMSSHFSKFKDYNPREAKYIINRFNRNKVFHFAVSEANSTIIDDYFNNCIKRVVYNSVSTICDQWQNQFFYPTIISVGSVQYIKGPDIWTKVAIEVCKINNIARFVWCGPVYDEELLKNCKEEIRKNGLNNRIHFLGFVSNPGILIQSAHLFYLPSRCDSMPLVVLEAMSYGKDIIYYNSGGVKEAVGDYGIFVDNFDIKATVAEILSFINEKCSDNALPFNKSAQNRYSEFFKSDVFVDRFIEELMKTRN
jgi:glycosyltransferase involved in cell wall biosynthesis